MQNYRSYLLALCCCISTAINPHTCMPIPFYSPTALEASLHKKKTVQSITPRGSAWTSPIETIIIPSAPHTITATISEEPPITPKTSPSLPTITAPLTPTAQPNTHYLPPPSDQEIEEFLGVMEALMNDPHFAESMDALPFNFDECGTDF